MMQMPVLTPDAASREFYERLARGDLQTTRCAECDHAQWPPRNRCTVCLSDELEWVDLPRGGKLLAFTTQPQSFRFQHPDVIGVAEVDGPSGDPVRFMCVVQAAFEDLTIGQHVTIGAAATFDGYTVLTATPEPAGG